MANDAPFNRLSPLIDRPINHAGDEDETQEWKIGYPDEMKKSETDGSDKDASNGGKPIFPEPIKKFLLDESAEKGLFGDRTKIRFVISQMKVITGILGSHWTRLKYNEMPIMIRMPRILSGKLTFNTLTHCTRDEINGRLSASTKIPMNGLSKFNHRE